MKAIKKTTLFLLAALAFTACRKDRNLRTSVQGRVITNGTNDKASSRQLKINLYHISDKGGIFAGGETLVEEGFTDTNGFYSFSFTAMNDYTSYWIKLVESQIENHTAKPLDEYRLKIGEHQVINIKLAPHAWLRLHVENINPQFGDRLTVNWGGAEGSKTFQGPVNTEVIFKGGGNVNRSVPFELYRNGEWIRWRDTIWMPAWDTTYYKVEY